MKCRPVIVLLISGILTLLIVPSILQAQAPPITWDKTYGGSDKETFDYYKMPMQALSDGGFIIGCNSRSGISGDKTEGSRGDYDFWGVRLDASGNKIWDKRFGTIKKEALSDISESPSGNLYWIGHSNSTLANGDKSVPNYSPSPPGSDHNDWWILKTDKNGVKLWDSTYGSRHADQAWESIWKDDTLILAGETTAGTTSADDVPDPSIGGIDSWYAAFDTNGVMLWSRRLGGPGQDGLNAVENDGLGGFIFGGGIGGPPGGDFLEPDIDVCEYLLFRTDNTGNKIWSRRYGSTGFENVQDILRLPGGDFIIIGSSAGDTVGHKSEFSRGSYDYWILRIDINGNIVWDRTYGGSGYDEARDGVIGCDGNILIMGMSQSGVSGERTQPSRGGSDYWIIKIDPLGNLLWDMALGGSSDDVGGGIVQSADGTYFFAGESSSGITGDKTEASRGMSDLWVAAVTLRADFVFAGSDTVCVTDSVHFTNTSSSNATSWLWNFGDPGSGAANTSTLPDPVHLFSTSGSFTVTLIITDGCLDDTLSLPFTVLPQIVLDAGPADTILCKGENIVLGSPAWPGTSYLWSPPLNLSSTTVSNPTLTADSSLTYTVSATDGFCSINDTIAVTVIPPLSPFTDSLCNGDSLFLSVSPVAGVSYNWSPAPYLSGTDTSFTTAYPPAGVWNYTLAASGDACTQTAVYSLSVFEYPIADFTYWPDSTEQLVPVHFGNASVWSTDCWFNFMDGIIAHDCWPEHIYYADGRYNVMMVADNGGCKDTVWHEVIIHTRPRLFVPNAFTPNGDGINDLFEVKGLNVWEYNLRVFDRNGALIFESTDPNVGWDGRYQGFHVPEGAYTWRAHFLTEDRQRETMSGTVLLMR